MNKKESVWLHISGDEYASMMFEQNFDEKDVYNQMIEEGVSEKTIELEGAFIEVEIIKFGEVDSKFESFVKNTLCDYDMLKHENICRIKIEDEDEDEDEDDINSCEDTYSNMEIGNLLFGNSRGEYPLKRGRWQETFCEFLDKIGLDGYGYIEKEELKEYKTDRGGFENEIFLVNPYYWGDDENIMEEPNFVYKPTGYQIEWYKYPLRDSYANQKLSFEELKGILDKCIESVKK